MSIGTLSVGSLASLISLADFSNVLALVNEITLTLAFIWAPGDAGNLFSALFIKMGQSPKFFSIYYYIRLEVMLGYTDYSKGLISYAPAAPLQMLMSYQFPPTNGRFEMYKIASRFIYNFWIPMLFLSFVVAAWLLTWLVELLTKSPQKGYTPYFIARKIRIIFQSFVIGLLYCNLGDIMLFAILEFQGTKYYKGTDFFSFFLALLFLIILVCVLCRHVHLLVNYQKIKKATANTRDKSKLALYKHNREGLQLFFQSFKDTSILRQLFLFIFMLRVALNNIFIGAMVDSPQAATILIFVITVLFIAFTAVIRPFTSIVSFVQHILFELVFLLSNIALLILGTLDANKDLALDMRESVSEILIFTGLINAFLSPIFLLIKLGMMILKYYRASNSVGTQNATLPVNNSVSHEGLMFDNSRGNIQIGKDMMDARPKRRNMDETLHTIDDAHPPTNFNSPVANANFPNNKYPQDNYNNPPPSNYNRPNENYRNDNYRNDNYREDNYRNDNYRNDNYRNDNYRNDNYRNDYRNDNYRNDNYRNDNYSQNQGSAVIKRNMYGNNRNMAGNYADESRGRGYDDGYDYPPQGVQRPRNYRDNSPVMNYESNYRPNSERNDNYIRTGDRRNISKSHREINEERGQGNRGQKSRVWHRKLDRNAYRGGNLPGRGPEESNEANFRSQIENRNRHI